MIRKRVFRDKQTHINKLSLKWLSNLSSQVSDGELASTVYIPTR